MDSRPIILYDYQNTRSSSCPKNFLGNFKAFFKLMVIMDITKLIMLLAYMMIFLYITLTFTYVFEIKSKAI